MKIIVCIKQVPDTTGNVAVKEDGTMDRASMDTITNPDDLAAVEAALAIKDTCGCPVTVVSMGPPPARTMLRETLAMGCDRAILISAREFGGSDTFATSQILAAALDKIGLDDETIVLCGRQAIDGDTAQVGPQIAEKLHLPQMTYAAEITVGDKTLTVKRLLEDGYSMLEAPMPCLITCVRELNTPRFPTIEGILDSFEREIELFDYEALKNSPLIQEDVIGLKGSPTNVFKSFSPMAKGEGIVLTGETKAACGQLVDLLKEQHIV